METINLGKYNPTFGMLRLIRKKTDLKKLLTPPQVQVYASNLKASKIKLEKYLKLFNLPHTGFLPITYPFILAMHIQLQLFNHPSIQINPLGLLHVSNYMRLYSPIPEEAEMEANCLIDSTCLVKKGLEIIVKTSIKVDSQICWECESTYLKISKKYRNEEGNKEKRFSFETYEKYDNEYNWHVSRKDAFSYARVSDDYNPIHLSYLFARFFGLPSSIIHGMWSVGKCLNYLDMFNEERLHFYHVFKGPIPLNSNCKLCVKDINQGRRFDLYVEGNPRPCIQGILSNTPLNNE